MNARQWSTLLCAALVSVAAWPAGANVGFCFGPTIQRGIANPVFDGEIASDTGWLNSFTYRGGGGAPDADILLQGNSFVDAGGHHWLALGVTALNDTEWDSNDAVVVLYKQSGSSNYGQLVIHPLSNDIPSSQGTNNPGTSQFSTSTTGTGGSWGAQQAAPSWVHWGSKATGPVCSAAQPGTNCQWTVELGLDLTAAGIPGIDQIFVDVIEVVDRNGPVALQFSYPPGNVIADTTDIASFTPAPSSWATASMTSSETTCPGVSFSFSDISASPVDVNGNLKAGLTTNLTVKLHNTGPNANGVSATFSHAPYGICGLTDSCFVDIGSTSTAVSCPSGGAPPCCAGTPACIVKDFGTGLGTGLQVAWTPASGDEGHQCIRVKLQAALGGTTFTNQGDFHNMWVDSSAQPHKMSAKINMMAFQLPNGTSNHRVRLNSTRVVQYAYADGSIEGIPSGKLAAQIVNTYRGYRFTGRFLTMQRARLQLWEPVGSYAFTLQQPMTADFQSTFEKTHAQELARLCDVSVGAALPPRCTQDAQGLRYLNAALARFSEKPNPTDWSFDLDQGARVGKSPDIVEVSVPPNAPVQLGTTASYGAASSGTPVTACCLSGLFKKTTGILGTAFGFLLLGMLAYRRRRP
ncbi:MAG TPA: hypothetical protein VGH20_21400 [Myxococcales bacterium]|jgi:hypothetical protein